MSFADFIAALEHEGINIFKHHTHWDENGILVVDYEDIDDVHHTINLVNQEGHVENSSAQIDKSGSNSNGHIIDSGEVHTEVNTDHEHYRSQSNSNSGSSSSSSGSSSSNENPSAGTESTSIE